MNNNIKIEMGFIEWVTLLLIGFRLLNIITLSWILIFIPILLSMGLNLVLVILEEAIKLLKNKTKDYNN